MSLMGFQIKTQLNLDEIFCRLLFTFLYFYPVFTHFNLVFVGQTSTCQLVKQPLFLIRLTAFAIIFPFFGNWKLFFAILFPPLCFPCKFVLTLFFSRHSRRKKSLTRRSIWKYISSSSAAANKPEIGFLWDFLAAYQACLITLWIIPHTEDIKQQYLLNIAFRCNV